MIIDGFMLIFKVIIILEVLKIVNLPMCFVLCLFSLIYDDRVFTWEQMMLHVIEFFTKKLEDKKIFIFNLL